MYYPETEKFGIIKEEEVRGHPLFGIIPFSLFDQVIMPTEGVNQEVFRNGTYIASIRYHNARGIKNNFQRVCRGDFIYYVSLAPRQYHFDGKITTKNGDARNYDMSVELVVIDSTRVIEKHHKQENSANWVLNQFKEAFESYVSKMENSPSDKILVWLNRKAVELSQDCGIKAINPEWFFHTLYDSIGRDEIELRVEQRKRELLADNEINELEERLRMNQERVKDDFAREKREKQNEFARREKIRQHINVAQTNLLSNTVDDLTQINKDRIRDALDYNGSVQTILEESLKLLAIFNITPKEEGEVVDAETTFLNRSRITKNEEENVERNTEDTFRPITTSNSNTVANTENSSNSKVHFQKPAGNSTDL